MRKIYFLNLFANDEKQLNLFLTSFFQHEIKINDDLSFEKEYKNPIDMIEIISTLVDNNEKFNIGIWITLDSNIYINITENNLDKVIRYLFERYPY